MGNTASRNTNALSSTTADVPNEHEEEETRLHLGGRYCFPFASSPPNATTKHDCKSMGTDNMGDNMGQQRDDESMAVSTSTPSEDFQDKLVHQQSYHCFPYLSSPPTSIDGSYTPASDDDDDDEDSEMMPLQAPPRPNQHVFPFLCSPPTEANDQMEVDDDDDEEEESMDDQEDYQEEDAHTLQKRLNKQSVLVGIPSEEEGDTSDEDEDEDDDDDDDDNNSTTIANFDTYPGTNRLIQPAPKQSDDSPDDLESFFSPTNSYDDDEEEEEEEASKVDYIMDPETTDETSVAFSEQPSVPVTNPPQGNVSQKNQAQSAVTMMHAYSEMDDDSSTTSSSRNSSRSTPCKKDLSHKFSAEKKKENTKVAVTTAVVPKGHVQDEQAPIPVADKTKDQDSTTTKNHQDDVAAHRNDGNVEDTEKKADGGKKTVLLLDKYPEYLSIAQQLGHPMIIPRHHRSNKNN